MKKVIFASLAVAAFAVSAHAQNVGEVITYQNAKYEVTGANMFVNGSFTDGVEGWLSGDFSVALPENFSISEDGGVDDGPYLTLTSGGSGAATTPRQVIAVEPGKTYYFSVYTSGTVPASQNLQYNGLFASNEEKTEGSRIFQFVWSSNTSVWSKTDYVFTATTEYVSVKMAWSGGGKVDDFVLVPVEFAGVVTAPLDQEIEKAEAQLAGYEAGTEWHTLLSAAIDEAKAANPATVDELNNAVTALANAENDAKNAYDTYMAAMADVKNVEDYNYYTENYTTPIQLGNWTTRGNSQVNRGQHWSGNGDATYYEPNQWGNSSLSWGMTQKVTLPAGTYVLMATGRTADKTTMDMQVIGANDEVLGTANFPVGDSGYGVNTSGAADFSDNATYANGIGRGWQWRYIPFTLDEETEVTLAVNAASSTTHQWSSISDFKLLRHMSSSEEQAEFVAKRDEILSAANAGLADAATEQVKSAFQAIIDAANAAATYDELVALEGDLANAKALAENAAKLAGATLTSPVTVTLGTWGNPAGYQNAGNFTTPYDGVVNPEFNGTYNERWNRDAIAGNLFAQQLKNMPEGVYVLHACVFANASDAVYLTVGNGASDKLVYDAAAENYSNAMYLMAAGTPEGTTLALTLTQDEAIANWAAIGDAKLYYFGNETTATEAMERVAMMSKLAEYEALLANAEQLAGKMMPADEKDALEAAMIPVTEITASNIDSAIEALQQACNNAKNGIGAYAALSSTIDNYANQALSLDEAGQQAYNNATATIVESFENGAYATAAEANEAAAEIAAAYRAAVLAQTTAGVNMTAAIVNASCAEGETTGWYTNSEATFHRNHWSVEGNTDGSGMKTPFIELWQGKEVGGLGTCIIRHDNVAPMHAGSYRLTGLVRALAEYADAGEIQGVDFYYNGHTVAIAEDGTQIQNGVFMPIDVIFTFDENDQTLTFGFNLDETNANWIAFKDFTLTYIGENVASAAEVEALTSAYDKAANVDFGFDEGQYAPYAQDAANFALLNEAKTLVDNAAQATSKQVNEMTSRLEGINWIANAEEMNAVYDGDFSLCENGAAVPYWSGVSVGGYGNSRAFVLNSEDANYEATHRMQPDRELVSMLYLRWAENTGAWYNYGAMAPQYAMPLKAGVEYELTLDFGQWATNEGSANTCIQVFDANSQAVATVTLTAQGLSGNPDAIYTHVAARFTPTADGNARISLWTPGSKKHYGVFTNFVIKRATPVTNDFVEMPVIPEGNNQNMIAAAEESSEVPFMAKNIVLTDGVDYNFTDGILAENVTYTRAIEAEKWATVCLPYAVAYADWSANCDVIRLAKYADGSVVFFYLEEGEDMEANTPYLAMAKEGVENLTFAAKNTVVAPADAVVTQGAATLTGIYQAQTVENGDYAVADGKFRLAEDNTNLLGAFRAYLSIASALQAPAVLDIQIGDETEGINGIGLDMMEQGVFYDLNGRKVAHPAAGIYIFNGQKVFIK